MLRLPRFVLPGHPQHVIVRGNDRQAIFYREEDYRFYLNKLKDAVHKHDCELKGRIDDIEDAEGLWQRFMPMGGQGLEQLQKFIPGVRGKSKNDESGD